MLRKRLEYLTGMVFGLYLLEDLFDLALLIDQEGGSMNTHVRSSHKLLLSPNAVSVRNLMVLVGQKGEGKAILGFELLV